MEIKRKFWWLASLSLAMLMSGSATAQTVPGTIGQLDDIQQRILIAQKQKELNELEGQPGSGPGGVQLASNAGAPDQAGAQLPGVMSVMGGASGSLMAILEYGNGQTVNVRAGTSIPGGYRVEAIGVEEVALSKDGARYRLAVGAPPTAARQIPAQAGLPGTAPMMPGALPR
ncbi:type IV pilus biogenesis protein PilP [Achromobacter insuavis]|uniref:type IV pilus biogenesis protein PilP n=1 Tax=Achromobacter insuavis TaxID=1287735 RepID=UPI001F1470DF|nr:type IV pilus biogenesis protein PilP [Achromobacter insuavis]